MSYTSKYVFATLPRTQRGEAIVLGGDPKGKNFLYTCGNSVIIRNIENPAISDVYTEHSTQVNVAKYSPSGFYIASADQSGKVRIWDTTQIEHLLKAEYQPFYGPIKDLSWSPDSQRIVIGGEGRERFGHVFLMDTGTSVGEISGQSKCINSCDYRPTRPFRIAMGSEDTTLGLYEGPPFKFKLTKHDHKSYVQAVRYSPNGEMIATGGFDGRAFLYDGKTADNIAEVGSPAHKGGIYGVAWSPDSKHLLTASGDKSCKLWDVATQQVVSEFSMGTEIEDQQLSCLWQGQFLLSISLSGFINYLDINNPSKPIQIVKGHNKPITAMTVNQDRSSIFTAGSDGFVTYWDSATGKNDRIHGKGHGNQINGMKCLDGLLFSCGIDDTVREASLNNMSYSTSEIKLGSQPRALASKDGLLVAPTVKEIALIQSSRKVGSVPIDYEPSCAALSDKHSDLAVGGVEDNTLHIYNVVGTNLSKKTELEHLGGLTDCVYSPCGEYLAACDTMRKVVVYQTSGYELAHKKDWCFHTARVNCVSWSPDSRFVASGSLDTNIIIWSLEKPNDHILIRSAHAQSQITRIEWLDNNTVVSTGQDSNTKVWNISDM